MVASSLMSGAPRRSAHAHLPGAVGDPYFTRADRDRVTLLINAVTSFHDPLIEAALRGAGYRVRALPVPAKDDFQAGKELGNNGMCNPAYFTAGALVNFLRRLRDVEGMATPDILRDYAFVTPGSCGPCRFGVYAEETRLALRHGGFDGFRVITFQQQGGLNQACKGGGIEFDAAFALALLNSIALGDLLNEMACGLRPYEIEPGQTDRVLGRVVERLAEVLARPVRPGMLSRGLAWVLAWVVSGVPRSGLAWIIDDALRRRLVAVLRGCAGEINEKIEVDFARPRPICKITGEFFAQMTEGDGNFAMRRFLEGHGAEVLPEPITTWVNYLLTVQLNHARTWRGLPDAPAGMGSLRGLDHAMRRLKLRLAALVVNLGYERMRRALGGTLHEQVCQERLAALAQPYYNRNCAGGEGHLEIGKTLYYWRESLAHMVLSLKPFGCLPSSQSDGAQAAVLGAHPDLIFLPVETSGEGDINAQSRVLMALGDARERCEDEFAASLADAGYTLEEVRAFCQSDRELRRPLQKVSRRRGTVGRGACFVRYVAAKMDAVRR